MKPHVLALTAAVAAALLPVHAAQASSHREAPFME